MSLAGIKKDLLQTDSFRMILKEALEFRPIHKPFDPISGGDEQVEIWKALSAEQRGFDKAFKIIAGISPEDFNNE